MFQVCYRLDKAQFDDPLSRVGPRIVRAGTTFQQAKVWFQNRRAKWQRQEKMDSSSMKLHDSPMLPFNRPPMHSNAGPMSNPWLTSPMTSAAPMNTIPGYMGPGQSPYLQSAYPSHSHSQSFLNSPPVHGKVHQGMVQGMQLMAPSPCQCLPTFNDK
eukprot:XP_014047425.1 PREDICTED: retinal homeobox protein Rx1-like [Salmo salar]